MARRLAFTLALAAAGLVTISCGGIVDPSKNQNETFTGTLDPTQTKSHPFTISKNGEFTAKLTALTPSSSAIVGMAYLTAGSDGSCNPGQQVFQSNNFVSVNAPGLSGQIFKGQYCLAVYDVGSLTATQTYTLTLSHP